jgi:hypothetical protein
MQAIAKSRGRVAARQSLIALGVLVTIGCTILALIVAQQWFLPEQATFAKYKRQVIERHLDAEVLILGASHSLVGIMPSLLDDDAVNLAGGAQDLYYCCALARRYLPRMRRLKLILLEVAIPTWLSSMDRSSESWRVPAYYFEFGISPPRWSLGSVRGLAEFVARRPVFGTDQTDQWAQDPFDDDGFYRVHRALDRTTGKPVAIQHVRYIRDEYARVHTADVINLVALCRRRGIEVVLVRLPGHACYRDELDQTSLARLQAMTDKLCAAAQVRYLDYFADVRFKDEHFNDCNHLNMNGATVFTKILARDLAAGGGGLVRRHAGGSRPPREDF